MIKSLNEARTLQWTMRGRLLLCCALIAALIGCNKGSKLVGTWVGSELAGATSLQLEVTFESNGNFKMVSRGPAADASLTATDTGTWKLDGDKLMSTVQDVDWQFTGSDPAKVQKARQRFLENKQKILEGANSDPMTSLVWDGNDKVTFTSQGITTAFTRKK